MTNLTAACSIALGVIACPGDPLVFTDTEFEDQGWLADILVDDAGDGTANAFHMDAGGNPGAFRFGTHESGPGSVWLGHLDSAALHYPGTGEVDGVRLEIDLTSISASEGASLVVRPLLYQSGAWFAAGWEAEATGAWTSHSSPVLVAADFDLVKGNGPAHPDFSFAGLPLTFGFVSVSSGDGEVSCEFGVDNFVVTLNPACEADCDCDGTLNILDFVCFQGLFQSGDEAADANGDGVLNILDFVAYQVAFQEGCG
jgi:hypothetical protein